jgi:hydrogenase nickel incorporation protein HypA/HybF
MHELSLMQSAIEHALHAFDRAGGVRIRGIRLRIGAWSGVVPEALHLAFEIVTQGTVAEGAILEVDTINARCRCVRCRSEFSPANALAECPLCGNARLQLLAGQELELASIEVSDA